MSIETLTRASLASAINKKIGFSDTEASLMVNSIINIMVKALINGTKINITNFGSFQTKSKNDRVGRNPKTLQLYPIHARKVIKFTISKNFKNYINNLKDHE